MKSLTIHQLDDSTSALLEERSRKRSTSLNKTIKEILRESLGVGERPSREAHFKEFLGAWTKKDEAFFQKNTKETSRVDPNDWIK